MFFAPTSQSKVSGSETDVVTNVKKTDVVTVITDSLATTGSARRGIEQWTRPPPSAFEITKIKSVSELILESSIPFAWTSSPAFFKFMHALRPDLFSESDPKSDSCNEGSWTMRRVGAGGGLMAG